MSELPLALVKPAGCQGRVGQHPKADESDEGSGGTLDDEKPAPAFEAADIVEASKNSGSDETRETGGENLGAV